MFMDGLFDTTQKKEYVYFPSADVIERVKQYIYILGLVKLISKFLEGQQYETIAHLSLMIHQFIISLSENY